MLIHACIIYPDVYRGVISASLVRNSAGIGPILIYTSVLDKLTVGGGQGQCAKRAPLFVGVGMASGDGSPP